MSNCLFEAAFEHILQVTLPQTIGSSLKVAVMSDILFHLQECKCFPGFHTTTDERAKTNYSICQAPRD